LATPEYKRKPRGSDSEKAVKGRDRTGWEEISRGERLNPPKIHLYRKMLLKSTNYPNLTKEIKDPNIIF
tara:strand:- start:155 stop:361 length:207 start_codon:yes stop_codon:yes gene_type:complete